MSAATSETATERLIKTVFRGDEAAYRRSLPERETVEGTNGWYTRDRRSSKGADA